MGGDVLPPRTQKKHIRPSPHDHLHILDSSETGCDCDWSDYSRDPSTRRSSDVDSTLYSIADKEKKGEKLIAVSIQKYGKPLDKAIPGDIG